MRVAANPARAPRYARFARGGGGAAAPPSRSSPGGSFAADDLLGAALEWRGEPGQLGIGLGAMGAGGEALGGQAPRPAPAPVS